MNLNYICDIQSKIKTLSNWGFPVRFAIIYISNVKNFLTFVLLFARCLFIHDIIYYNKERNEKHRKKEDWKLLFPIFVYKNVYMYILA